jgi:hypothetical protein
VDLGSDDGWVAVEVYRPTSVDVYADFCSQDHAVEWLRDRLPPPEIGSGRRLPRVLGLLMGALVISWLTVLPIAGLAAIAIWIVGALRG